MNILARIFPRHLVPCPPALETREDSVEHKQYLLIMYAGDIPDIMACYDSNRERDSISKKIECEARTADTKIIQNQIQTKFNLAITDHLHGLEKVLVLARCIIGGS